MSILVSRLSIDCAKSSIENRRDYFSDAAVLRVYDTYEPANMVELSSSRDLLYCAMVTGKKVMHIPDEQPMDFLPSESFVMHPYQDVYIDFPQAQPNVPTTCIAIEIDQRIVEKISEQLCYESSICARTQAMLKRDFFHSRHDSYLQLVLENIVRMLSNKKRNNLKFLVDVSLTYLLTEMMREEAFRFFLESNFDSRIGASMSDFSYLALSFLRENLRKPLDIDALCHFLCMRKSKLYLQFKKEFGTTPERLFMKMRCEEAKSLLQAGHLIKEVSYLLGFKSQSHFCRLFTAFFGESPSAFKKRTHHSNA